MPGGGDYKICRECNIEKPINAFYTGRNKCIACKSASTKNRYRTNPEKYKAQMKKWRTENLDKWKELVRKNKYGLTAEDFQALKEKQNSACAICGKLDIELVVDHDHKSKRIRGLLCRKCNSGLGFFGDSITSLAKAIEYISEGE